MLLFPLSVIVDLLGWALFIDTVTRTTNEFVMWAAFGLAFTFALWPLHEGIRLATAKLGSIEDRTPD